MTTYTTNDLYPEGGNYKAGDICNSTNPESIVPSWIYTGLQWVPNSAMVKMNEVTGVVRKVSAGAAAIPVVLDYGNTLAMLGDSWTPAETTLQGVTPGYYDYDWIFWAKAKSQGRFRVVLNAGVPGERTDQILLRVQAVIDSGCKVCTVIAGKNDISKDVSAATILANLDLIYTALTDCGIKVIACTVPPYQTGYALITAARSAVENVVNDGIRRRCLKNPLLRLADVAADLINPTASPTVTKANYLRSDNLHLAGLGARAMGEGAIYQALVAEFDPVNQLPSSVTDTVNVTAGNTNILTNPLFTGTGGASSAGGGTVNAGTIAQNYFLQINSGTPTVTPSNTTREDGIGQEQVLTIVSASASDSVMLMNGTDMSARVSNGDVVKGMCMVSASGMTNVTGIDCYLAITVGGQAYFVRSVSKSGTPLNQTGFTDYLFETQEWTVPDGAITVCNWVMRVYFGGAGGATVKYSRAAVRKI